MEVQCVMCSWCGALSLEGCVDVLAIQNLFVSNCSRENLSASSRVKSDDIL